MSGTDFTYRCSYCGRTEKTESEKPAPVCCEKTMVKNPLDQCTIPDNPEMIRNTDEGEPCDDGRGK